MEKNEYKHLNLQHLKEYFLGDLTAIRELFKISLVSVESDFKRLRTAIESKDLEEIAKNAHKLKSAFRYLGVFAAGTVFEEMETKAKTQQNFTEIYLVFSRSLAITTEVCNDLNLYLKQ